MCKLLTAEILCNTQSSKMLDLKISLDLEKSFLAEALVSW